MQVRTDIQWETIWDRQGTYWKSYSWLKILWWNNLMRKRQSTKIKRYCARLLASQPSGKCCVTTTLDRPPNTCEPRDRTASGTRGLSELSRPLYPFQWQQSPGISILPEGLASPPRAGSLAALKTPTHAKARRFASWAHWSWLLNDARAPNLLAVLLTLLL